MRLEIDEVLIAGVLPRRSTWMVDSLFSCMHGLFIYLRLVPCCNIAHDILSNIFTLLINAVLNIVISLYFNHIFVFEFLAIEKES